MTGSSKKNTMYILLVVGILGLAASIWGTIQDGSIREHIIGFVCGVSLLWGYVIIRNELK